MNLVSQAAVFATNAHDGMMRKGTKIPYIVHPMEVAAIAASLTDDPEVIAAALLHDVMEDCGVTQKQLFEQFGEVMPHSAAVPETCRSERPLKAGKEFERRLILRKAEQTQMTVFGRCSAGKDGRDRAA